MKRVVLNIDRLVLKGFGHAGRPDVAASLQSELTRLLGDAQVVDRMAKLDGTRHLLVAPLAVAQNAGPRDIGVQVARSILAPQGGGR